MISIIRRVFLQRPEVSTDGRLGVLFLPWLMGGGAILLLMAMKAYPGSALVYLLFSGVFVLLLACAFYRQRTYGYTFLAVFLWLGFWLKVSWHLAWGNGFPEPTGQFAGAAEQWDRALLVSTVGGAAVIVARILFHLLTEAKQSLRSDGRHIPQWLRGIRLGHWFLFLVAVVIVSVANFHFQIFVIGLKTGSVLVWPLNGLITLMLVGGGFAAWMATLLWFEIRWKTPLFHWLVVLIVVSLVITSSSLSRGLIVMLLVPLAYALYVNAERVNGLSRQKWVLIFLVLCGGVAVNFFIVNHLREGVYFKERAPVAESAEEAQLPEVLRPMVTASKKLVGLVNFSIDRWVGIEGMMAVTAYPGLNRDLLSRAVAEPPVKRELSIYSRIAPWPNEQGDVMRQNVGFMSMPGGLAFLYYSGSLWTVFLATILIVLALQYLELLIYMVTRNPLLCASIGWLLALSFAHFGGAPKALLPGFAFLVMVVALLAALQSRWIETTVKRALGRA